MIRSLLVALAVGLLASAACAEELLLDPVSDPFPWAVNLGWEFPGAGGTRAAVEDPEQGPCLEGRFDFTAKSMYSGLNWWGKIEAAQSLGFMIKLEDRDGGFVRVRDASGQELLANFTATRGKWTRVQIEIKPERFSMHWQGADDGKPHFPLVAVLIGVGRGPDHAQMRLSNLYIVLDKAEPADCWRLTVEPAGASGVVFQGPGGATCKVRVLNRVDRETSGTVEVGARSTDGRSLAWKATAAEIKGWKEWTMPVAVPVDRPGYWRLTARFVEKGTGGRSAEAVSGLAIVPKARHYGEAAPDCYFGLQFIPDMEAAERLGCKALRISTGWRWCEVKPGDIAFEVASDPSVNDALKHNMDILFLLQSDAPEWVAWKVEGKPLLANLPDPTKMDAWRDYCRRMAERYRGKIAAYEIQNEPDLTCSWQIGLPMAEGVDYYCKLFQAGYEGVKAGDPGGQVAGIDVSGGDFDWKLPFTAAVLDKADRYLDLYTAHPYSGVRYFGPDQHPIWPLQNTMDERCRAALDLLERHGKARRMWIGELGWGLLDTADPLGPYSMDFAACMAQALVVGKSVPGVEKFIWFTFIGCNENGYEYGLLRGQPAYPLPAAMAYATAAWVLDDTKPLQMKRVAGELCRATFACERRKEVVSVWWSEGDEIMVRPPADAPKGVWWTSFYGHPSADKGRYRIGRMPIYWVVPMDRPGKLPAFLSRVSAEAARPVGLDHVYVAEVGRTQARLGLLLTNKTSAAQRVQIEAGGKRQTVNLPAGARAAKAEVTLPVSLPVGRAEDLAVAIAAGDTRQVARLRVNLTALPAPPAGFKADGDLTKWANVPGFDLHERGDVLPADPGVGWKGPQDLSMKAHLAANARGLYFAAAVTDDVHFAPGIDPTNFWASDSIQIALDPNGDTPMQFDDDDREIGFVLGADGPRAFVTYPVPMRALDLAAAGGEVAIRRVGTQTVYEAFVPWSALGVAAPKPGQVMAINFIANDNDGHGRAFWMGLTPGIGEAKNAGAYRKFVFAAR